MARYIDADKLIDYFRCAGATFCYGESTIKAIISRIEVMPTADVEEVVRCQNCRYCSTYRLNAEVVSELYLCDLEINECKYNFFCSYGERKEK